jgi:hypothetical protein
MPGKAACFLIGSHDDLEPGSFRPSSPYAALKGRQVDKLLVCEYIAPIASGLINDSHEAVPELPEDFALRGLRETPVRSAQPEHAMQVGLRSQ